MIFLVSEPVAELIRGHFCCQDRPGPADPGLPSSLANVGSNHGMPNTARVPESTLVAVIAFHTQQRCGLWTDLSRQKFKIRDVPEQGPCLLFSRRPSAESFASPHSRGRERGGHSARRRRGAVTIITIKLKTSCYDITYYAHDTKFKSKLQNIRSNITKVFIGKLK